MAHYLVRAKATDLAGLRQKLDRGDVQKIPPSGGEMYQCLNNARMDSDGWATWEENCYCSPPLRQERLDLLDAHFTDISTENGQQRRGLGANRAFAFNVGLAYTATINGGKSWKKNEW